MKRRFVLIFGTTALALATLWTAQAQSEKGVTDYRGWTQVNPNPLQMSSWVSMMCADSPKLQKLRFNDPHSGKFFVVYVNAVGKTAMLTQVKPKFPVGTVIVKEKLPTSKEAKTHLAKWKGKPPYPKPELLTTMRKREKGYFPEGGDWEYSVMDGTGQKTLKTGKLETCVACRAPYRDTDFVTRNYLPEKLNHKLYPKGSPALRLP